MLVRGFDFGRTPEVTWGDVCVPLKDRLDQLSGETSGRIELGSGTTTFTVKIPSGARAATAAKPSWRGEAGGGAGVTRSVDGLGTRDGEDPAKCTLRGGGRRCRGRGSSGVRTAGTRFRLLGIVRRRFGA